MLDIDDRHAQFVVAVGDLCLAAQTAGLTVDVVTGDGGRVRGAPSSLRSARGEGEVDDSGYAETFVVDGQTVVFEEVVSCAILAPGA